MTTDTSVQTPEQLIADLEAEYEQERLKLEAAMKAKLEKARLRIEAKAEEIAISNKRGELISLTQDFYRDAIRDLGIVIPEKGLTFRHAIKLENGPNGSILCSVENIEKAVRATGTGTRAPRGAGNSGRASLGAVEGIKAFSVAGQEIKGVKGMLQAIGADPGTDSAPRFAVAFSLKNRDKANDVTVLFEDGTSKLLGDLVTEKFGSTESAPPPPPPVPASN